jgi:Phospholipase_D-nuclease N-terminal
VLAALIAYTFGMGLATAALVVWVFVWFLVAVRVLRRTDLGVGGKILWLLVILLVPILGLFAYFLWDAARPRST